jgi:hypothetical protein
VWGFGVAISKMIIVAVFLHSHLQWGYRFFTMSSFQSFYGWSVGMIVIRRLKFGHPLSSWNAVLAMDLGVRLTNKPLLARGSGAMANAPHHGCLSWMDQLEMMIVSVMYTENRFGVGGCHCFNSKTNSDAKVTDCPI